MLNMVIHLKNDKLFQKVGLYVLYQLKNMRLRTIMNTSKCLLLPIWNIPADFPYGFVI